MGYDPSQAEIPQMAKQSVQTYEWGCTGMGCFGMLVMLVFMPLIMLIDEKAAETHPNWFAVVFLLLLGVLALVFHFKIWPALNRPSSEGSDLSGHRPSSSSPGLSGYSSGFRSSGSNRRRSEDDFPWEAFAYGYLLHELLDDDSDSKSAESWSDWSESGESDAGPSFGEGEGEFGEDPWEDF